MSWIVRKMKWVMLVSGALTLSMIYAAIDPDAAMQSTFGAPLHGPAAHVVVRSWGVLIALVGGALIYGAYVPQVRALVLTFAGLGKVAFIALVLARGTEFLSNQAGVAVVCDTFMVLLFILYLMAAPRSLRAA
jgi:hypothetical protein